jgi:polygalacturonase
MVRVHHVTPFGFVFELENEDCAITGDYEVLLNEMHHLIANSNALALYGLECDTEYEVSIKKLKSPKAQADIRFTVKTPMPQYVVNVRDYNAAGDGKTDDTSAINAAMYTAVEGAVVYIPAGEYIVDQIFLKSGIDLYLEAGAVVKQNTERAKLAVLKGYQQNYTDESPAKAQINASWEGHPQDCYCSLVYGKGVENVHIYGAGVLDGNGDTGGFWVNPKIKNKAYRPKNILLVDCKNITVSGITSRNSASWNIHPFYCEEIKFLCIFIESAADSPNTDGINPESCENVDIIGCHFDVGDDCIAIKSGKHYMSVEHLRPTKNITVRNCTMVNGHGGVVAGSEMSCGIYNVVVTQCSFVGTDRGLRIKTRRGRGKHAIVDGITFSNVIMQGVRHCFVINMYYFCDPDGKSEYVQDKNPREKDEYTPTVKNITVANVRATGITGSAVFIYGLPESKVTGVNVVDNSFLFAPDDRRVLECPAMMDGFEVTENISHYCQNIEGIVFKNNIGLGDVNIRE